MGITISGENNNDRILASDGVIDQLSGFNVVGVMTATSFTGDLTGDVTGNLTGNVTGNINNTTLLLQTGGTERLRIDSDGRVLIGTNIEGVGGADELTIANTSSTAGITLRSSTTATGNIYFSDGTSGSAEYKGVVRYDHSNNDMSFWTHGSEKLRILDTGEVGIGIVNPDEILTLANPGIGNVISLRIVDPTASTYGAHFSFYDTENEVRIGGVHNGTKRAVIRIDRDAPSGAFMVNLTGKVGIGTDNPKTKLNVYTYPDSNTGGILVQNANYAGNVDKAYLIAGTQNWTGAATDWNTYGFQHKLKSDGGGIPRLTIDASSGSSNLVEIITFSHQGKVGIGTATIASNKKLDVCDGIISVQAGHTHDTRIEFHRKNTGSLGWIGIPNWDPDGLYIYGPTSDSNEIASKYTSGAWHFYTSGSSNSEKLRITSAGLVDIFGSASQSTYTPLLLQNSAAAGNGSNPDVVKLAFGSQGSVKASIRAAVYGEGHMTFHTNNDTEKVRIESSGKLIVKSAGMNLENASANNSRGYSITNAAGTTGWTFGNGITASTHQYVIYDNSAGSARFQINGNGAFGLNGGNYGAARQVMVSNGSGSAVSWSSNPFLLDMDSLGDIDYDGVFLRYREVNVSGNGLVYLGLCKSTTNCPAGRIGIPVGYIPGVAYNSQFRVDKVGITPWPDSSGHRYEFFAIISDYVSAGKLGIFYLTNSTN